MSQISKYPVSKVIADRIFDVFVKTLVTVKNKEEANNLAHDLFSPTEKVMLAKRIGIAFLLMKEYQYREISKILRVSLTTIASVNLSLKYGKQGYSKILDRISKEEKLEDFFGNIVGQLLSVPASSQKGGSLWRYLRDEVKKKNKIKSF